MSNLEHLIENTLNYMDNNPNATYKEIISAIKDDINYLANYIDARDICYICLYVRYIYVPSKLSSINADIKSIMGYAQSIKLSDLNPILQKNLSGEETLQL